MAYNRIQARRILSAAEFELFEATLAGRLERQPRRMLETRLQRARNLADKYRDLLKRQQCAARRRNSGGSAAESREMSRTAQKVRLFQEMSARLEKRLTARS